MTTAIPGSYGLPVIGVVMDLLDFWVVSGWHRFFARRQLRWGSTVFKINLFRPTIAVLDRQGIELLFASPLIRQDYGFSWAKPPLPLVGNVVPSIFASGPAHDTPKAVYLAWLAASASTLSARVDAALEPYLNRWLGPDQRQLTDDLESYSITLLFDWLLDLRPDVEDVRLIYNNLFSHFMPGASWFRSSTYSRSLVAYNRLLEAVARAPGFAAVEAIANDMGWDNRAEIVRQITFVVGMNAYLGTQSLLKSLIGELSRNPEQCGQLRGLLQGATSSEVLTCQSLDHFVRETLRLHPPVTFIFGRATAPCRIESSSGAFAVASGELVMGVLPFVSVDNFGKSDGQAFRPARHEDPAVADYQIWPRGLQDRSATSTNRTCPAKDISVELAKLTVARIVAGHVWELDEPVRWTKRMMSLNVAAPVGSMTLRWFARVDG